MEDYYDIIIIGAGPSGSYLSTLLTKSVGKVLLVDKRIKSDILQVKKPCSGLIAVPAQAEFLKFAEDQNSKIYAEPKQLNIKVVDTSSQRFIYESDTIYNINRLEMENEIISRIPSHIQILNNCAFLDYECSEDSTITVSLKIENTIFKVKTKKLVGADGANSKIRNKSFNQDSIARYFGVEWFLDVDVEDIPKDFNIILAPELTDYYLWAFPKNKQLLVGGVFKTLKNPKEVPLNFINHLKKLKLINSNYSISSFWVHPILRPLKSTDLNFSKNNIHLIGEAAGLICPTSAEGYSYAFQSALNLSLHLNDPSKANINKNLIQRIFLKRVKKVFIYNTFFRYLYFTCIGKKY